MKKSLIATLALSSIVATPLYAGISNGPPPSEIVETTSKRVTRSGNPTVALTLSFAFGSGGVEPGIGLRVLSDNRRTRAAATVGLDYMFTSESFRGTVGAAYIGRNIVGGADVGYNFSSGNFDFGLSAGGAPTKSRTRTVTEETVVPPMQRIDEQLEF